MSRTTKAIKFEGALLGIEVKVSSDRDGSAKRLKRKVVDTSWKRVVAAAKGAAEVGTSYGRALIDSDPRRVLTGYMRGAFEVRAKGTPGSGGYKVVIGWPGWSKPKPYYDWQESGTYSSRLPGYMHSGLRKKGKGTREGLFKGIWPAKYLPRVTKVFRSEFYGRLK